MEVQCETVLADFIPIFSHNFENKWIFQAKYTGG